MFTGKYKSEKLIAAAALLILFIAIVLVDGLHSAAGTRATILALKGDHAYKNSHWGDAGIRYDEALKYDPGAAFLRFNLADAFYQQGRYAEAKSIFEGLAGGNDDMPKAPILNNLGNVYYKLGLLQQSYQAYGRALLIDDHDTVVRQNWLFIDSILRRGRSAEADKSGKDNRDGGKKDEDTRQSNEKKQKAMDEEVSGSYEVSDEEMNRLLLLSKEQERVPDGARSSGSKKSKTNQPDY